MTPCETVLCDQVTSTHERSVAPHRLCQSSCDRHSSRLNRRPTPGSQERAHHGIGCKIGAFAELQHEGPDRSGEIPSFLSCVSRVSQGGNSSRQRVSVGFTPAACFLFAISLPPILESSMRLATRPLRISKTRRGSAPVEDESVMH